MKSDAVDLISLVFVGVVFVFLLVIHGSCQNLYAHHDGNDEQWRQAQLAACEPAWDPRYDRIHTYDGRTLHQEPFDVKDLFYRTWGDDDLDGGQHLRRWRWEYECIHPPVTVETTKELHDGSDSIQSDRSVRSRRDSHDSAVDDRRDDVSRHTTVTPTPTPEPTPTPAPTPTPTPEPTPTPTPEPTPTPTPTLTPTMTPTPTPEPAPTVESCGEQHGEPLHWHRDVTWAGADGDAQGDVCHSHWPYSNRPHSHPS